MNKRIIDTTNEYVKKKDLFIYLGDFLYNKRLSNKQYVEIVKFYLDQLICKNIIFICGNHDRAYIGDDRIPHLDFWNLFKPYHFHTFGYELYITKKLCADHTIPVEFEKMLIVCTHYACRVWNKSHYNSLALFGHSHHKLPSIKNSFDVGFNGWNRPLELVEILTKLMPENNKKFGENNALG